MAFFPTTFLSKTAIVPMPYLQRKAEPGTCGTTKNPRSRSLEDLAPRRSVTIASLSAISIIWWPRLRFESYTSFGSFSLSLKRRWCHPRDSNGRSWSVSRTRSARLRSHGRPQAQPKRCPPWMTKIFRLRGTNKEDGLGEAIGGHLLVEICKMGVDRTFHRSHAVHNVLRWARPARFLLVEPRLDRQVSQS